MSFDLSNKYFNCVQLNLDPRVCPVCGITFNPTTRNNIYCSNECYQKAKRDRRQKYKEKEREYNKLYRDNNRNRLIIKDRLYYQKRKKEIKEYNRQYYLKHYEELKDYSSNYRKSHKWEIKTRNCCKRHNGIENCPYSDCIWDDDCKTIKICPICGKEFKTISIAHKYCSDECRHEALLKRKRRRYKLNSEALND